jgi:2-amino-4-hydroxy-6-hydroxymethyldihydropteridine diphosphokinase
MPMSKVAWQTPDGENIATLGLGSNIGDKAGNIDRAIALLTTDKKIRVITRSRDFRSEPWGVLDQDWFINAAVRVATRLSPRDLLRKCQSVENDMGRVRQQKWGPRLIDVDILTYRDMVISEPDLTVPHPLIAQRAFVLLPLQDVAPDVHIDGQSLDVWIERLQDTGTVAIADESIRKQ